jgi:predicted nuclease with TOPRIM domain
MLYIKLNLILIVLKFLNFKKILEKLNSIESKMSSFNESIKKTEDKLERVILNQQTFSTKLETIEKNSVSKLNLTPVIYLFCKFFISN